MKHLVKNNNNTPNIANSTSPFETLTRSTTAPMLNDKHTFGYPVYALSSSLATDKAIPKWGWPSK
eukprot:5115586-Ditylum_brightwellii.AAC.1